MKCFMHPKVEAVSVCKRCGKAMCTNCSSYTGHSGICPVCKKEEYQSELFYLTSTLKKNTSSLILSGIAIAITLILGIVFAIVVNLVVALLFFVIMIVCGVKTILKALKRKPMKERIKYLAGEISKIEHALLQGTQQI